MKYVVYTVCCVCSMLCAQYVACTVCCVCSMLCAQYVVYAVCQTRMKCHISDTYY